MKKIISNLKKGGSSIGFRRPTHHDAPHISIFSDIIKEPMDLGTIETKLKNRQYTNVEEYRSDFNLIVDNCYLFNGVERPLSEKAARMASSFNNQMKTLPPLSLPSSPTVRNKTDRIVTRAEVEETGATKEIVNVLAVKGTICHRSCGV